MINDEWSVSYFTYSSLIVHSSPCIQWIFRWNQTSNFCPTLHGEDPTLRECPECLELVKPQLQRETRAGSVGGMALFKPSKNTPGGFLNWGYTPKLNHVFMGCSHINSQVLDGSPIDGKPQGQWSWERSHGAFMGMMVFIAEIMPQWP